MKNLKQLLLISCMAMSTINAITLPNSDPQSENEKQERIQRRNAYLLKLDKDQRKAAAIFEAEEKKLQEKYNEEAKAIKKHSKKHKLKKHKPKTDEQASIVNNKTYLLHEEAALLHEQAWLYSKKAYLLNKRASSLNKEAYLLKQGQLRKDSADSLGKIRAQQAMLDALIAR